MAIEDEFSPEFKEYIATLGPDTYRVTILFAWQVWQAATRAKVLADAVKRAHREPVDILGVGHLPKMISTCLGCGVLKGAAHKTGCPVMEQRMTETAPREYRCDHRSPCPRCGTTLPSEFAHLCDACVDALEAEEPETYATVDDFINDNPLTQETWRDRPPMLL